MCLSKGGKGVYPIKGKGTFRILTSPTRTPTAHGVYDSPQLPWVQYCYTMGFSQTQKKGAQRGVFGHCQSAGGPIHWEVKWYGMLPDVVGDVEAATLAGVNLLQAY